MSLVPDPARGSGAATTKCLDPACPCQQTDLPAPDLRPNQKPKNPNTAFTKSNKAR